MSTIKSSDEHLTLNADGSSKDIKFQANGVEKASIDSNGNLTVSGNLTSLGIDDNADATAITINSSEQVGIGVTSPDTTLHIKGTNQIAKFETTSATGQNYIRFTGSSGNKGYFGYGGGSNDLLSLFNQENYDMAFGTNDTERMRILAGGGLTFNGDTAAANALDDYEEGNWTPVSIIGTASSQSGTYTRIGRFVHCEGSLTFPSQTNSGHVTVGGLPFTINGSENGSRPTGSIRYTAYDAQDLFIHGNPSATTFNLYKKNTGGVSQTSYTDMSSRRFDFNFQFQV